MARKAWPHKLLVPGIQSVEDAERVVELGRDRVVLSNHGGPQLDRSPTVLRIFLAVRERLGPVPAVLIASGIMSRSDILATGGLGADAAMVGRAYLHGLTARGEGGVTRALEILRGQYVRSMQLLGVKSTAGGSDGTTFPCALKPSSRTDSTLYVPAKPSPSSALNVAAPWEAKAAHSSAGRWFHRMSGTEMLSAATTVPL